MGYVIDFFHNKPKPFKGYLLRLRATSSGIVDLAGNTITNHGVDYTSTPSSRGGGGNSFKI